MNLLLTRTIHEAEQTLGTLIVFDKTGRVVFRCQTLELPYRDNIPRRSCAPTGVYPIVREWSPRFAQYLYELYDVPLRSEIKIHVANYVRQLHGCIAVGDMHTDIDRDGLRDVRNSRRTLNRLHKALEGIERTEIKIIDYAIDQGATDRTI